jgi:UDP-N-acetylglucosamine--N-acetylmuramyl-(pentapeptide) pyrophosphoryl-undecaprenol N-acetylglucosamine transferase
VARLVSAAAVHFEETAGYFRNARVTGVPVRQAFFEISARSSGNARPVLLVFGGSQGAHAINQAVIDAARALRARVPGIQIIHQTGEHDYNDAQAAYASLDGTAVAHRFIDDMPSFFARADLILCRSGASTVAELTAAARPSVLVPFPRAADDHQKKNAEALERAGAAVMLEESNLSRSVLVDSIGALLGDPRRLAAMREAAHKLSHPGAARDIAAMAAELAASRA